MITEDYVSFETAKLLKEKGFDEPCDWYINDAFPNTVTRYNDYGIKHKNSDKTDVCSAPTLQMAMKWLREVHHLVIQIEFIDFLEHGEVWLYSIIERKTIKQLTDRDENFTEHSYEEACEAAIKYCLENLI
jgi:hypothetical protein